MKKTFPHYHHTIFKDAIISSELWLNGATTSVNDLQLLHLKQNKQKRMQLCDVTTKCSGKACRFGGWSSSCTSAFIIILLPCFLIIVMLMIVVEVICFCSDVVLYLFVNLYILHQSLCIGLSVQPFCSF